MSMKTYITPTIQEYNDVSALLSPIDNKYSIFEKELEGDKHIMLDDLLDKPYICVVGEPGIGKSRLLKELASKIEGRGDAYKHMHASEFGINPAETEIKYYLFDALDEVDESRFHKTLIAIDQFKKDHFDTHVIFTCRKHYIETYLKAFTTCKNLHYIEINRIKDNDRDELIKSVYENWEEILKNPKLKELLAIPRYMDFLLQYKDSGRELHGIGDLFNHIVQQSITEAIKKGPEEFVKKETNLRIVIERVLMKIAFIMEIGRRDRISIDELYSIIDGIRGNMAQMLIANVDILYFENRILIKTNEVLKFENTELQEYLAAKELCRQDNIESVLYDIAVNKTLQHIYPNWYDIIPHISYIINSSDKFFNIIKSIISYERNLKNTSFETLLKYIDPNHLFPSQKQSLFILIAEHYLRGTETFNTWRNPIAQVLQKCYNSTCDKTLKLYGIETDHIKLHNIWNILETISEKTTITEELFEHWRNISKNLIKGSSTQQKVMAINLFGAIKDKESLIEVVSSFDEFTKDVKERYCDVTSELVINNNEVVDCWINGCSNQNPNAINAVLRIVDPGVILYAYKRIIEEDKLQQFFSPIGSLAVLYSFYLTNQVKIGFDDTSELKLLLSQVFAAFVSMSSYSHYTDIQDVVKQIILDKEAGTIFISNLNQWECETTLTRFSAEYIDATLISTIDKLLTDSKMEEWVKKQCLLHLVNKIRKDESKRDSIAAYITRFSETFEQWDKTNPEQGTSTRKNKHAESLYLKLSDPAIENSNKATLLYNLCHSHWDFVEQQDQEPILNTIKAFFEQIDLSKLTLHQTGEQSYSISKSLMYIPNFVRTLTKLGRGDLLSEYKIILAQTLPICSLGTYDSKEIKSIYNELMSDLTEPERKELINWWKERTDDFMNASPSDIISLITDYGFTEFSYKLEEYIDEYIEKQDYNHSINALIALPLIADGYCNWDMEHYKRIFEALRYEEIGSVKLLCNSILIEKYQDTESINWRIDYLKKNKVESYLEDTGEAREISWAESEMTDPNPTMFRCFVAIKGNEHLNSVLVDLFDFGLSLSRDARYYEYASYILRQIYDYFIHLGDESYFEILHKRVEHFNERHVSFMVNEIMNQAEMSLISSLQESIEHAVKAYNNCIDKKHLAIRNDADMRRFFTKIQEEVQKEIQDQGIYSLVRAKDLNEDFIQRELKNTIINVCCRMGLNISIDREVALQDNKRTDLLIRYGMCRPIMVELKLLHNQEIQSNKLRQAYKPKFVQYTRAANACLSVFWIFDVHHRSGSVAKYGSLKSEYSDLDHTQVIMTDCKCSSGFDTGIKKK